MPGGSVGPCLAIESICAKLLCTALYALCLNVVQFFGKKPWETRVIADECDFKMLINIRRLALFLQGHTFALLRRATLKFHVLLPVLAVGLSPLMD